MFGLVKPYMHIVLFGVILYQIHLLDRSRDFEILEPSALRVCICSETNHWRKIRFREIHLNKVREKNRRLEFFTSKEDDQETLMEKP